MTPALLLALAASAAGASSARVFLKPEAASGASACRSTPADGNVVVVPLFARDSESCPVARVAGQPIELRELAQALEQVHLSRPRKKATPGQKPDADFKPALDRLIDTRLILLEAHEMQLDADPKFRANVDQQQASRLRTMIQESVSARVKPYPAEVERLYRDSVREWELASVLFEKEADAKAFEAALAKGGSFDALAKAAVAEKKAKGAGKPEFTSKKHMLPEVVAAAEKAKVGVPFGPLKVPAGWTLMRIVSVRYPPGDKAARAEAEARSRARLQQDAIRRFYLSLRKKYAKVDEALVKQLDFEAKGEEGFKQLIQDQRPLATIEGEKPITVSDLAAELASKFFHGIKDPIEQHRVNPTKDEGFEKLLGARLFAKEAAARKLASRPEFRREMREYERGLTFAAFIEKVIVPDVKITEKEAVDHYAEHLAEYTAPEMFKLDGVAFATAKDAQAALDKLKAGTDFSWYRSTAPNQLPLAQRSLQFDGRTLSAKALPRELVSALAGTKTGDYRQFSSKPGEFWVIRVEEHSASAPQPYAQAREEIAKKLFNEKVTQGIRDYAAKLRKAQRVDVLITRISL